MVRDWINIESRKRKELLGLAEKRVLEMIGDGAGISENLGTICAVLSTYMFSLRHNGPADGCQQAISFAVGGRGFPASGFPLSPWPVGPTGAMRHSGIYRRSASSSRTSSTEPNWPIDIKGGGRGSFWITGYARHGRSHLISNLAKYSALSA